MGYATFRASESIEVVCGGLIHTFPYTERDEILGDGKRIVAKGYSRNTTVAQDDGFVFSDAIAQDQSTRLAGDGIAAGNFNAIVPRGNHGWQVATDTSVIHDDAGETTVRQRSVFMDPRGPYTPIARVVDHWLFEENRMVRKNLIRWSKDTVVAICYLSMFTPASTLRLVTVGDTVLDLQENNAGGIYDHEALAPSVTFSDPSSGRQVEMNLLNSSLPAVGTTLVQQSGGIRGKAYHAAWPPRTVINATNGGEWSMETEFVFT